MNKELTMIGFPEKILRYAAAGILIEEGEVSRELALSVATGEFRLDHYPKIDGAGDARNSESCIRHDDIAFQ